MPVHVHQPLAKIGWYAPPSALRNSRPQLRSNHTHAHCNIFVSAETCQRRLFTPLDNSSKVFRTLTRTTAWTHILREQLACNRIDCGHYGDCYTALSTRCGGIAVTDYMDCIEQRIQTNCTLAWWRMDNFNSLKYHVTYLQLDTVMSESEFIRRVKPSPHPHILVCRESGVACRSPISRFKVLRV
jgi:hypothetical protein